MTETNTQYVVVTHSVEHYDETNNKFLSRTELTKFIEDGNKPSSDRTNLGMLVKTIDDAKALKRAKEIEEQAWISETQITNRYIAKVEAIV